jgi:hypothetical protein
MFDKAVVDKTNDAAGGHTTGKKKPTKDLFLGDAQHCVGEGGKDKAHEDAKAQHPQEQIDKDGIGEADIEKLLDHSRYIFMS